MAPDADPAAALDRKLKQAVFFLDKIEASKNDAWSAECYTSACVSAIRSVLKYVRSALERDGKLPTKPRDEADAAWGEMAEALRAGMPEDREKLGRWVERLANRDIHSSPLEVLLEDSAGWWSGGYFSGAWFSSGWWGNVTRLETTHGGTTHEVIDACRAGIEVAERTIENFKARAGG